MSSVNDNECDCAGIDRNEVLRIAKGISRYAKQAEALGIVIFGGSGSGSLRFDDNQVGKLVLAELDGLFDGGDGATSEDDNGYLRGEA